MLACLNPGEACMYLTLESDSRIRLKGLGIGKIEIFLLIVPFGIFHKHVLITQTWRGAMQVEGGGGLPASLG